MIQPPTLTDESKSLHITSVEKKGPRLMNKFLPQYSPKGPAGKFTTILVYIPNSIREEKKLLIIQIIKFV